MERSLRVLVVDDEAVSRTVIESYLATDGHHVVTATNTEEAIGHAEAEPFDLLITDHAMPGMNGVQLAAVFREMRAGHPVILVTGFAANGTALGGDPGGIDLIMRKLVPRRALRHALDSVMGA